MLLHIELVYQVLANNLSVERLACRQAVYRLKDTFREFHGSSGRFFDKPAGIPLAQK